jgi:hypothetical protein
MSIFNYKYMKLHPEYGADILDLRIGYAFCFRLNARFCCFTFNCMIYFVFTNLFSFIIFVNVRCWQVRWPKKDKFRFFKDANEV